VLVVVLELVVAIVSCLAAAEIMLLLVNRWTSRTDNTSLTADVSGWSSLWPVAWFLGVGAALYLVIFAVACLAGVVKIVHGRRLE
jgi:hypothetical protein